MNKVEHIKSMARELAQSGKFRGWAPIAFELRFEEGFKEAREWLYSSATRIKSIAPVEKLAPLPERLLRTSLPTIAAALLLPSPV